MKRRDFLKCMGVGAMGAVGLSLTGCINAPKASADDKTEGKKLGNAVAGTDGDKYVPYEERTGNESIVYFTRDLSAAGLLKIYDKVGGKMSGKVGVKLHTGEKNGPNIIPRPWVKNLMEKRLPNAHIVETNTYYAGDRYTTEQHRETLKVNGWTFTPVDIMDEDGTAMLSVKSGK